jgi:hypothetical protein
LIYPAILLGILGGCLYGFYHPQWQFDHLEQNARKAMTAQELQVWATKLLTYYTNETYVRLSELGTNFPRQLRGLAPRVGPSVFIHAAEGSIYPVVGSRPAYIQLVWGSGFLGSHGIEVGPPEFTGARANRQWQPGVYFY